MNAPNKCPVCEFEHYKTEVSIDNHYCYVKCHKCGGFKIVSAAYSDELKCGEGNFDLWKDEQRKALSKALSSGKFLLNTDERFSLLTHEDLEQYRRL